MCWCRCAALLVEPALSHIHVTHVGCPRCCAGRDLCMAVQTGTTTCVCWPTPADGSACTRWSHAAGLHSRAFPACVHASAVMQVYKPGSTSVAAQLLDARDLFDAGSARSDKLLRQLTGQLDDAVTACATAAGAHGAGDCLRMSAQAPAGPPACTVCPAPLL